MGGLFGGAPATPEPPKPTPMADESTIAKKRKNAWLAEQARGGRASTIMSQAMNGMAGTQANLGG